MPKPLEKKIETICQLYQENKDFFLLPFINPEKFKQEILSNRQLSLLNTRFNKLFDEAARLAYDHIEETDVHPDLQTFPAAEHSLFSAIKKKYEIALLELAINHNPQPIADFFSEHLTLCDFIDQKAEVLQNAAQTWRDPKKSYLRSTEARAYLNNHQKWVCQKEFNQLYFKEFCSAFQEDIINAHRQIRFTQQGTDFYKGLILRLKMLASQLNYSQSQDAFTSSLESNSLVQHFSWLAEKSIEIIKLTRFLSLNLEARVYQYLEDSIQERKEPSLNLIDELKIYIKNSSAQENLINPSVSRNKSTTFAANATSTVAPSTEPEELNTLQNRK